MEYLFITLILIVAVTIIVILAKRIASHPFRCKHCSKEFSIKWSKVMVTEHFENEYIENKLTRKQIADEFDVSELRIRQIISKALRKIRKRANIKITK